MMSDRNSRKRNIPARLREETWYLVCYEDDNNLRVLGREEIRHIFPDDNDDAINVGDIVSAIWIPNGQFYDAKILQKGADRNELMKERVHLEKAQKNNAKEDSRAQQKRKDPEDSTDGQKKKKKKQADSAQEKEKKAKEREEKRKKKEQDQERQKHILEARKAQAAARLATSCNNLTETEVTIFTPQPILQPSTTPSSNSQSRNSNHTRPPLSCETSQQLTPPAHPTFHVPSPDSDQNVNSTQNSPHSTGKTPLRPNKSATPSQPRRGLHFQSAIEDYTDDEVSDEGEEGLEGSDSISNSSNCCEDHKLEVEALRKRLDKVHKRLNIALKAKTSGEVVKSRPGAGILDKTLAAEYKMVEVMEGTGVYWYPHQRAYCAGYINAAIDIFFTKETLAVSCAKGNEKKGKNGHQPLDPLVIDALIGKVCSKFSKDSPVPSQVVQKINMKCVEARRPQRIRIARQE